MSDDDSENLSPKVLLALNKEFKKAGMRICTCHQGHPLPLDEEHFYFNRRDGRYETVCKSCRRQQVAAYGRARYHSDPVYAQQQREQSSAWARENRERNCMIARQSKRRRRRARFAALLQGVAT